MSPHLPKKTDSFLSKFSFSQHLEMETVQDASVGVVRNTELNSTIRTMFPLTATIMMTVSIYIIMGEWFILISSLYTLLKTSFEKWGLNL